MQFVSQLPSLPLNGEISPYPTHTEGILNPGRFVAWSYCVRGPFGGPTHLFTKIEVLEKICSSGPRNVLTYFV